MLYKLNRNGGPTEYVWKPDNGQGKALMLGTMDNALEIADRILKANAHKDYPLPTITEYDEALAPCYTVPEAVAAAMAAGLDTDKRRLGVTIRSAARRGSIAGAYRTAEGYWRLPTASFNAWLAEYAEQRRGRPRKETAEDTPGKAGTWQDTTPTLSVNDPEHYRIDYDSLDAYTVELWRNRISGDQYAIKRDSTGIVVGACGPFPVDAGDVHIGDVDWSLDLAHTLQIDRLLGGFEVLKMGE